MKMSIFLSLILLSNLVFAATNYSHDFQELNADDKQFELEEVKINSDLKCAPLLVFRWKAEEGTEIEAELTKRGMNFQTLTFNSSGSSRAVYSSHLQDGTLVLTMQSTTSKIISGRSLTIRTQNCAQLGDIRSVDSTNFLADSKDIVDIKIGVNTTFSGLFNRNVCAEKFDKATQAEARKRVAKILVDTVMQKCGQM